MTCVQVHLDADLFIKEAAFLSKTKRRLVSSYMQQAEECFICSMLTCVSFPSAWDRVTGAGLVLTGSWWGVMRDANSHNLSLEADQLVTSKFIQRVLSLHLPYFEVALFHLWVSVRDRVFIPSSATVCKGRARKQTHACVWVYWWCVSQCCVFTPDCVFVCSQEVGGEKAGGESANLY